MSEIIENNRERATSENSEADFDPQFKPIVNLPEVEVITNEEHEDVLLKLRAKLYRFDTSSDPSEWKERGTGELKLLQNKDNNAVRIVMRRDKTYKVCANHFITPWMTLKPCSGSEKAFLYTVAADFADEEPKGECLAIRFGNVDNANLFKNKFEEAKDILKTKCKLYNGECLQKNEDSSSEEEETSSETNDTVEVTEKLAKLNVENGVNEEETKK